MKNLAENLEHCKEIRTTVQNWNRCEGNRTDIKKSEIRTTGQELEPL